MPIICTYPTSKQEHFVAESLHVRMDCHCTCIGAASRWQILSPAHSFQDEAETANYAIFCPQPTSHEDKQVTIVLGLRVNKYYVLFFQF